MTDLLPGSIFDGRGGSLLKRAVDMWEGDSKVIHVDR